MRINQTPNAQAVNDDFETVCWLKFYFQLAYKFVHSYSQLNE